MNEAAADFGLVQVCLSKTMICFCWIMRRVRGFCRVFQFRVFSSYDLLDQATNSLLPMTFETITDKDLGFTVTVTLEKSPEHPRLMPMKSLLNRQGNPMEIPISNNNRYAVGRIREIPRLH